MERVINKSKKQIIIEEAAVLIRDKGYVATTMRELAAKVGMEAASLYNHIKSKEQILHEICFSLADIYTLKMKTVGESNDPPLEKIQELISLHIQINSKSSSLASVMNDEWRHLSAPEKERFLNMRHDYENKFIDIIKLGIEHGEIKKMDPSLVLFTLLSSLRWLLHWYYSDWKFDSAELASTIRTMIFDGIVIHK